MSTSFRHRTSSMLLSALLILCLLINLHSVEATSFQYIDGSASCSGKISLNQVDSFSCGGDGGACSPGEAVLVSGTGTLSSDLPDSYQSQIRACKWKIANWMMVGCFWTRTTGANLCDTVELSDTSGSGNSCPSQGTYSFSFSEELAGQQVNVGSGYHLFLDVQIQDLTNGGTYAECSAKFKATSSTTMTWSMVGMVGLAGLGAAAWIRKRRMRYQPVLSLAGAPSDNNEKEANEAVTRRTTTNFVEMVDRGAVV